MLVARVSPVNASIAPGTAMHRAASTPQTAPSRTRNVMPGPYEVPAGSAGPGSAERHVPIGRTGRGVPRPRSLQTCRRRSRGSRPSSTSACSLAGGYAGLAGLGRDPPAAVRRRTGRRGAARSGRAAVVPGRRARRPAAGLLAARFVLFVRRSPPATAPACPGCCSCCCRSPRTSPSVCRSASRVGIGLRRLRRRAVQLHRAGWYRSSRARVGPADVHPRAGPDHRDGRGRRQRAAGPRPAGGRQRPAARLGRPGGRTVGHGGAQPAGPRHPRQRSATT